MQLVPIREGAPALTDIIGQLRQLADAIEKGECGNVMQCAVVTDNGKQIHIYGWGDMPSPGSETHLLLELGVLKMQQGVMEERT